MASPAPALRLRRPGQLRRLVQIALLERCAGLLGQRPRIDPFPPPRTLQRPVALLGPALPDALRPLPRLQTCETFRAPPLSGCCRFARRNHVSPVRATPSLDRSDMTMCACGLSGLSMGPSTPPDAPPPCTAASPPGSAAARTPAPPRTAASCPARSAARPAPPRTDARWSAPPRRPPASSLAHPQPPTAACCRARRAPPRPASRPYLPSRVI